MDEEFGPLDWYRAKTVEEMRSDLVTMAQGNYFDNNKEYAFMSGGKLVIRTGADLNDQAPEGPGPEEYQQMSEEQIVEQYVSRIKMYPAYEDIADQEGFASAFLPALDNMNNVASVYGNKVQYGNGMELASEIQTGAITDYIATGFKSKEEFYKWYLSDVANIQAVLQPGQTQAEDFSIVDEGFYEEPTTSENFVDPMSTPNTKIPRRPQPKADSSLFKQPGKDYYKLLQMVTAVGKGTAEFLTSAAKGPGTVAKKAVENIKEGIETSKEGPSLLDIVKRLTENPGTMKIEEDTNE
jgi:hypothetical protein